MKVFYHNDLDGRCAGAVLWKWYKEKISQYANAKQTPPAEYAECEFIEINDNVSFPLESIEKDIAVYILDYSIQPDEMRELLAITRSVVWIDHHKTAIEKYADFPLEIYGRRDTKRSGAFLTWEFFYPHDPYPEVVRLVDDWDMWTHEKSPNGHKTRFFVQAMKSWELRLDCEDALDNWDSLLHPEKFAGDTIAEAIEDGMVISTYEEMQNAEHIYSSGHSILFEGHNCICSECGQEFEPVELPSGGVMTLGFADEPYCSVACWLKKDDRDRVEREL